MRVERQIEIEARPERVYAVLMDPSCLERWVTIHAELQEAPPGELREGSELVQCLKLAGRKFTVHWTVIDAKRPARVEWTGQGPVRSRAGVIYELAPDGHRTTFHYVNEFHLPGGLLGEFAGRAVRRSAEREADRSLERLKELLE
jgi:carbon monoxide dehydrogenase subunit G